MADLAIVYCSVHHGNTKKLLDAAATEGVADLFSTEEAKKADLSHYHAVGFASGVYMSKLHRSLYDFLAGDPALPKKAFLLYTCGSGGQKYGNSFVALLKEHGIEVCGVYSCKGFDTFGPFKLVGGVAKGHPTPDEIGAGVQFVREMAERAGRE